MNPRSSVAALALCAALVLVASGCAGPDAPAEDTGTTTSAAPSAPMTPEPAASSAAASPDAGEASVDPLVERDEFIADQQQPLGQATMTAQTDAQKELVAQQRAHVESNGGQWSEQAETVTLALALDACETSILNEHRIDLASFRTHVATSPLIENLAAGDPSAREGAVSIMVFGTGFLCPEDAPQWEQAWVDAAGEY